MWLLLLGLAHASTGDLYDDPLTASEPLAVRLNLEIDPRESVFHGELDMDIVINTGTDVLGFTGWDMDYRDVQLVIDGENKHTRRYGSLQLNWTKKQAGTGNVRVEYDGTLWTSRTTGMVRQQVGDAWHVTSRLYPDRAPYLLPLANQAKHHVPWTISARVPIGMHAISNGIITADVPDGEGWHKVTFATTPDITGRQVALAVGPYHVVEVGTIGKANVPVNVWLPAGSHPDIAWMNTEINSLVLALESSTGVSYPDAKLDIVAVDGQLDAVHHYGLMTIGLNAIDLAPDADITKRMATTRQLASELAAAWTGGHRSPTSLDHTWLRGGLGSWLGDRAVFSVHEDWNADDLIADDVQSLLMYADLEPNRAVRSNFSTLRQRQMVRHPVHRLRGAATMRAMQSLHGEPKISQAITSYFAGDRHPVTLRTLDDIVRKNLGNQGITDLRRLLDHSDIATITATVRCPPGRPARIRLRQTVRPDTVEQRLPICVRWGGAEQPGERCLVLDKGRGTVLVDAHGAPSPELQDTADSAAPTETPPDEPAPLQPSPNCPTWVIANAGGTGLYRVSRSFDEAKALMHGDLSLGERSNIASDALAQLPFDQALALQPALFQDPNRLILDLHRVDRYSQAVGDPLRATWNARLRQGIAAHVGLDNPGVHRGPAQRDLRVSTLHLRGIELAEKAVIDDAAAKSNRWVSAYNRSDLRTPNPLKQSAGDSTQEHWPTRDLLSTYLPIAVYHGRIDNIKKLTAHLQSVRDPDERTAFVRALAAERSPERVQQILDDMIRYRVGSVHVRIMLEGSLKLEGTRSVVQAFIDNNLDLLAGRMQQPDRVSLIRLGSVGCYEGQSAAILRLFAKRSVDWPGGPEAVDAAVVRADNCRARADADEQAMSAWLPAH